MSAREFVLYHVSNKESLKDFQERSDLTLLVD